MKNIINIILALLLTLILSSCFTSQEDVNKAKQNLWIIEIDNDSWSNLDTTIEEAKKEIIQEVVEEKEDIKTIEITSLTDEQFLEFDDLSRENLLDWEVELMWKTLSNVDKIIVYFVNEESDFPDDIFTLSKFKSWDETFLYRAFSRYETLDFWKNVYIFEAYSGDEITKLQIVLNIVEVTKNKIDSRVEDIELENESYEEINISDFPVSAEFWTPVELWNGKISYTDLKWLEIKRDVNPDLTCENLTSVLSDKINTWFFWNTCRPIEGEEWVSFFVIRLDWDNYIYEKHYYLSYEWIYWIQELEKWVWVDDKNIWEKNTELKEWNDNYTILKIVDELFKKILK